MVLFGIVGIILLMVGILDKFIDFFILFGVVFLLILGVMLVDYYVLCINC